MGRHAKKLPSLREHMSRLTTEPRGPLQVDRGYSQTRELMMTLRGEEWMMRWEDWA